MTSFRARALCHVIRARVKIHKIEAKTAKATTKVTVKEPPIILLLKIKSVGPAGGGGG